MFNKIKQAWVNHQKELNEKDEEKAPLNNTYSINFICTNCKHIKEVNIPKKTTAESIIKDEVCNNCGLKNLKIMDVFDEFNCFNLATGKIESDD